MSTPYSKRIYSDPRWRAIRAAAIYNAHGRCQLQLPGCTGKATQADHIIGIEEGGQPFAYSNTQASCRHCNICKENMRRIGVDWRSLNEYPPLREW